MKSHQTPNAVRLFPFRLRKDGDFFGQSQRYHFAEVVLAQKNEDAINPGQLVPLGGKCKKSETPFHTLIREAVEETSCRGIELMRIRPVIQHYTFYHAGKKQELSRTALFAAAEIFSNKSDLHPQNTAEDKLVVRSIDSGQFHQLLTGQKVKIAGRNCSILDSLDPDQEKRQRHGTDSNEREVLAVRKFLLHSLEVYEAKIKKQVLEMLVEKLWSHFEATIHCRHYSDEHDRLIQLNIHCPQEIEVFFDSFVRKHHVPLNDLVLSFEECKKH